MLSEARRPSQTDVAIQHRHERVHTDKHGPLVVLCTMRRLPHSSASSAALAHKRRRLCLTACVTLTHEAAMSGSAEGGAHMGVLRTRARTPGSLGCTESLGSTRGGRVSHDYTHELFYSRDERVPARDHTYVQEIHRHRVREQQTRERREEVLLPCIHICPPPPPPPPHAPLPPSGPSVLPRITRPPRYTHVNTSAVHPAEQSSASEQERKEGTELMYINRVRLVC